MQLYMKELKNSTIVFLKNKFHYVLYEMGGPVIRAAYKKGKYGRNRKV
jgi:hypothetical protein